MNEKRMHPVWCAACGERIDPKRPNALVVPVGGRLRNLCARCFAHHSDAQNVRLAREADAEWELLLYVAGLVDDVVDTGTPEDFEPEPVFNPPVRDFSPVDPEAAQLSGDLFCHVDAPCKRCGREHVATLPHRCEPESPPDATLARSSPFATAIKDDAMRRIRSVAHHHGALGISVEEAHRTLSIKLDAGRSWSGDRRGIAGLADCPDLLRDLREELERALPAAIALNVEVVDIVGNAVWANHCARLGPMARDPERVEELVAEAASKAGQIERVARFVQRGFRTEGDVRAEAKR